MSPYHMKVVYRTNLCVISYLALCRAHSPRRRGDRVNPAGLPELALFGPPKMSDLSRQSGAKRTLIQVAVISRNFMSTHPSLIIVWEYLF
jgi:hypothetical protein